jgi:hypothetical protein
MMNRHTAGASTRSNGGASITYDNMGTPHARQSVSSSEHEYANTDGDIRSPTESDDPKATSVSVVVPPPRMYQPELPSRPQSVRQQLTYVLWGAPPPKLSDFKHGPDRRPRRTPRQVAACAAASPV